MIARMWHGRVPLEQAEHFGPYLHQTGVLHAQNTPGYRGASVWKRLDPNEAIAHFTLLTYWESFEAVKAFAGEDYEVAVTYPEDAAYGLDSDPFVTHMDVLEHHQIS